MSLNQLVVVIGGSRGTGLLIAQRLQHQGLPLRILARNPLSAQGRLGSAFHIIAGDITQRDTLPRALESATHVVFTAGWRSGRPAMERHIRETEYGGVVNTLRSEEHTSELQSLAYLVCRLLLEKKKKKDTRSRLLC